MNQTKQHSRFYGPLMMLLACLCFSGGGLAMKMVPWNALAINGVRNLLAAGVLGLYLIITHHRLKFNKVVLMGALCMFGVTTLFTMANKLTTAANAIILQYTAPIWIIIMMLIFFKVKPKKFQIVTIIVVAVGILCFFFDSISAGDIRGDLVAIISGVAYAGVFMLNQFEKGDALSSMFFGQLACGIALSPFAAKETDFSPTTILAMLFLGIIQVGLAYLLFNQGTKYTQPVTASLIAAVEPILNPIWVAIFWGETLAPMSFVGAIIVIAAVVLYNTKNTE